MSIDLNGEHATVGMVMLAEQPGSILRPVRGLTIDLLVIAGMSFVRNRGRRVGRLSISRDRGTVSSVRAIVKRCGMLAGREVSFPHFSQITCFCILTLHVINGAPSTARVVWRA